MKDLCYYKDIFEAREFDDVEGCMFLAHVLEVEQNLEFNPYDAEEVFNKAMDVYGLKINGIEYAIHPVLNTLFTFTAELVLN